MFQPVQWRRKKIENGGLDLSTILTSKKIKGSLNMVMYNFEEKNGGGGAVPTPMQVNVFLTWLAIYFLLPFDSYF